MKLCESLAGNDDKISASQPNYPLVESPSASTPRVAHNGPGSFCAESHTDLQGLPAYGLDGQPKPRSGVFTLKTGAIPFPRPLRTKTVQCVYLKQPIANLLLVIRAGGFEFI